jgi:hypothetical protein
MNTIPLVCWFNLKKTAQKNKHFDELESKAQQTAQNRNSQTIGIQLNGTLRLHKVRWTNKLSSICSARRMTIKKMSWHFYLLLLCLYYRFFPFTSYCFSPAEEGIIPPKIFRSNLQGKELRNVTGQVWPRNKGKEENTSGLKITHSRCLII